MAKKPAPIIPFHLVIDARGDHVLLACGAPQAAAYITWNTAAVTCDACLFVYNADSALGIEVGLLQSFYSFPPSRP